MSKPEYARVLDILRARQQKGVPSKVVLRDGRELMVHNVVSGYDMGDPVAHITTNINPSPPETPFDFFFATEVFRIIDPENDAVWFESETNADGRAG